jgi:hypothetical protein
MRWFVVALMLVSATARADRVAVGQGSAAMPCWDEFDVMVLPAPGATNVPRNAKIWITHGYGEYAVSGPVFIRRDGKLVTWLHTPPGQLAQDAMPSARARK